MKPSNAHRICEHYGYPLEVETLLDEVCRILQQCVPGLRSILLSGSVATGDLVYRHTQTGFKIFSDLDLLAFADAIPIASDLEVRLRSLEKQFETELFHIDLSMSTKKWLRRDPLYQMAELRQVDSLLFGEDCRGNFPLRVDVGFTRQSLLMNLWKVVLYWPDGQAYRRECFQWVLARLILDIPLLVFSERQHVLPGHFARAQAFCALTPDMHPLARPSIQKVVGYVAAARRNGVLGDCDLWPSFLESLDTVLCYLKVGVNDAELGVEQRAHNIERLLPRRSLRRLGGELRSACQHDGKCMQRWSWWLRRKEAWACASAIEMIACLAQPSAERYQRVAHCLSQFRGQTREIDPDQQLTIQFRWLYWDALVHLYPSLRHNEAFVRRAAGASDANHSERK